MHRQQRNSQQEHQDQDRGKNPVEILRNRLFEFLYSRFGWPIAALLVILVVVCARWDSISKVPVVDWALTEERELLPPPKARGDRFTIVIPRLENDADGTHRRLVSDGLRSRFPNDEVEVLLVDQSITIEQSHKPQEAVRDGRVRARELLRRTSAHVIIWGEALDSKPDALLRLHWMLDSEVQPRKTSGKYRLTHESYDLPDLFRDDLNDVLGLLVGSEAAEIDAENGRYLVERLQGFILKVRQLVNNDVLAGSEKATLEVALANALAIYSEQRGDSEALFQSLSAFQKALTEYTRARTPLLWANTQRDLGEALATLGGRESGTEHLWQAVAAYQEALKELTRERWPLAWAATQNNLGNTLWELGKRESGTERFEQAIAAHREALKEFTRERVPLAWAMTQDSLGDSLAVLGTREGGTERLVLAVAAFREAQKGVIREQAPLEWARIQNNLGTALVTLGGRERKAELLKLAAAALQESLKERAREKVPLYWAATQINLGNAHSALGKLEKSPDRFILALAAYCEGLKELTRERVPLDWATTQYNIGIALEMLGELEGRTDRFEQAAAAYREALKEFTHERLPLNWAATQDGLGVALFAWGMRESGTARFEQAAVAFQQALKEYTTERSANERNRAIKGLEYTQQMLEKRKGT